MVKINIVKDGQITNSSVFDSQEQADIWLNQEQINKSFGDNYDVQQEDVSDQLVKANEIADAMAYLAKTDWYVIRYVDNGKSVPDDIKAAREQARKTISELVSK